MKTLTQDFVKENLPKRPIDANKGTMGTLLNISGSYSMAGACVLSSLSALKSGVGLLKVALPQSIYPIVASSVFEAVYLPVKDSDSGTVDITSLDFLLDNSKSCSAVVIGCGLKMCDETTHFVREFVMANIKPILIDADGINALSRNINILKSVNSDVVLTPHPKEMSRLTSLSVEYIQENRVEVAEKFAKEYGVTVVLKGKDTVVTNGENTFINPTGNAGMAKGGSGDVLSGIIGSLIAQGVGVFEASCCGVFIHGMSGDLAAKELSKTSMLPSDIVSFLPQVFKELEK
ncbi:MAG: NAD(P)H-hydrate dehydratase [Ruminococcus sp.]|nr:NAD(P)H-hydrate dehydratase [Ruminococcus sp.]